jgi:uncharacterized OsmC-like protein/esterase/lipase
MPSKNITFSNAEGTTLSARLELPPDRRPLNFAIFAHCFTCNKNFRAVRQISSSLAANRFGVLSFDFTGLGDSGGDFSDTTFSGSVSDLIAAAEYLETNYTSPSLMIGHSLGGAATILAASKLESVKAVVTIGSPSEPQHVKKLFRSQIETIEESGASEVDIGGRPFVLKREFIEDLDKQDMLSVVGGMDKAFLFLHSPEDNIVGVDNAAALYKAARHPKSFISLSGADHLLTAAEDGQYAGDLIASWAARYVPDETPQRHVSTKEDVVAYLSADEKFTTIINAGGHRMTADEPESFGGNDFGPSPYGFASSGLAACTAMTLRLYADRKGWDLGDVAVHVSHSKVHAADCSDCESGGSKIDNFVRTIELSAELSDEQKAKLLEIADKCPVHRTLEAEARIETMIALSA